MIDVNFRTRAGAESVGEAILQKFNLEYRTLLCRFGGKPDSYSIEVEDCPAGGIPTNGVSEADILHAFTGACLAVKFLEVAHQSGMSPKCLHPEMHEVPKADDTLEIGKNCLYCGVKLADGVNRSQTAPNYCVEHGPDNGEPEREYDFRENERPTDPAGESYHRMYEPSPPEGDVDHDDEDRRAASEERNVRPGR
jgi:hypothetical protein